MGSLYYFFNVNYTLKEQIMFIINTKVYLPVTKAQTENVYLLNCIQTELENVGLKLSDELLKHLETLDSTSLLNFIKRILKNEAFVDVGKPLYYDWDKTNPIVLSPIDKGGDIYPFPNKEFIPYSYVKDYKVIELATKEEARERYMYLIQSVVQHRHELENILTGIKLFGLDVTKSYNPQVKALYLLVHGLNTDLGLKVLPSDLLRYLAVKHNLSHWNLPDNVKFDKLSWQTRLQVLGYLDKYDTDVLLEAFGKYRGLWKKLFSSLHLLEQKQFRKYVRLQAIVFVSLRYNYRAATLEVKKIISQWIEEGFVEIKPTNILAYRTFESRVKTVASKGDVNAIIRLMDNRAGYLYNNLQMIAANIPVKDLGKFLAFCISVLPSVSTHTLLSLIQINTKATYRIIDIKGDTIVQPANYPVYFDTLIAGVTEELHRRLKVDGYKFYADDAIKDKPLPFMAKNQALVRGTKLPLSDQYLHFVLHWVETTELTDLDHSWVIIHDDNEIETIYWRNINNEYIQQSGDVREAPAPDGGTEYSVIDLMNLPSSVKYIIPVLNSYSGDDFGQCVTAYAGFMFNKQKEFIFNPSASKFYLTQNAKMNVPFLIDVNNKELIITDYNQKHAGNLAIDSVDTIFNLIKAISEINVLTVKKFTNFLSDPNGSDYIRVTDYKPDGFTGVHYSELGKYLK